MVCWYLLLYLWWLYSDCICLRVACGIDLLFAWVCRYFWNLCGIRLFDLPFIGLVLLFCVFAFGLDVCLFCFWCGWYLCLGLWVINWMVAVVLLCVLLLIVCILFICWIFVSVVLIWFDFAIFYVLLWVYLCLLCIVDWFIFSFMRFRSIITLIAYWFGFGVFWLFYC